MREVLPQHRHIADVAAAVAAAVSAAVAAAVAADVAAAVYHECSGCI